MKSSGQNYLGRSVAPGALSIWTHHLNEITYHEGQFKLARSRKKIPGDAITAVAGTAMMDLYITADKHNRTIVGCGAKTVSLGGYVTGGGHSIMAPHYGLAADNVLQMEVVTPKGEIITVNEDQHSGLFWAIRGVSILKIGNKPAQFCISTWSLTPTPTRTRWRLNLRRPYICHNQHASSQEGHYGVLHGIHRS